MKMEAIASFLSVYTASYVQVVSGMNCSPNVFPSLKVYVHLSSLHLDELSKKWEAEHADLAELTLDPAVHFYNGGMSLDPYINHNPRLRILRMCYYSNNDHRYGGITYTDEYNELHNICEELGVDFEDIFLHYRKDTLMDELLPESKSGWVGQPDAPREDRLRLIVKYSNIAERYAVINPMLYTLMDVMGDRYPTYIPLCSNPGDIVYFGHYERFKELNLKLDVKASGDWEAIYEYWTGKGWTPLEVTDGTNLMTKDGRIQFVPPIDWYKTSINTSEPWWYVRLRCTRSGNTDPIAKTVKAEKYIRKLGDQWQVPGWDPSNDGNGDGFVDDEEFSDLANPLATARFRYQARAVTCHWDPQRWLMNMANPDYLKVLAVQQKRRVSTAPGKGKHTWAGVRIDNTSPYFIQKMISMSGISGESESPLAEYRGRIRNVARKWEKDFADCIGSVRRKLEGKMMAANVYGAFHFPDAEENLDVIYRENLINVRLTCLDFERKYSWVADAHEKEKSNAISIRIGNLGRTSEAITREQIYVLACFYIMQDPSLDYVVMAWGLNRFNFPRIRWIDLLGFDIGKPTLEIPAGCSPAFETDNGTYILHGGCDPGAPDKTYKVYAREYTKALVVAKPLSCKGPNPTLEMNPREYSEATTTIHRLGSRYRRLYADGTVGSLVNQIELRNAEGAILIKEL